MRGVTIACACALGVLQAASSSCGTSDSTQPGSAQDDASMPDAQPLPCAGLDIQEDDLYCNANGRCSAGSIPFTTMGGLADSGCCLCLSYDGSAPTCAQVYAAQECICVNGSYACNSIVADYDGGLDATAVSIYCSGGG